MQPTCHELVLCNSGNSREYFAKKYGKHGWWWQTAQGRAKGGKLQEYWSSAEGQAKQQQNAALKGRGKWGKGSQAGWSSQGSGMGSKGSKGSKGGWSSQGSGKKGL